jgi:peptidoglycan/xylan/chitin deacetylase (PgdA/CDA1 family)
MRLFRPGILAGWLYPDALFRIKTTEKILYLTFDDGPDRITTSRLLDTLGSHNIKGLFFCNGKAAEKHPDLMNQIRERGHLIGNHGYNHHDGLKSLSIKYINDVARASRFTSDKIFRPPYGRLSLKQYNILKKSYTLVFWDLMAYDFDSTFGSERSLEMLKEKIRPGSIIVLHDTASSCANKIIEEFIIFALDAGYKFELIKVNF